MRTDIHRPSAPEFDPEAYNCAGVFDLHPEPDAGGFASDDGRMRTVNRMVEAGYRFASHQNGGQCGHCGSRIRYAALMIHDASHEMIYIGETCLDGRFEMLKAEFQALRKAAQLDRERIAREEQVAQMVAENPALVWASYADNFVGEGIDWHTRTLADIWAKAHKYGSLSDKQVAFVGRLVAEMEEKTQRAQQAEERRTAREAEDVARVAAGVTVPTGRVQVEGTVVSTRFEKAFYGYSEQTIAKMLVVTDEGWKTWGTMPAALLGLGVDKGTRVRFTATVKPSDDDPLFGYASRPTKASIV